MRYGLAIFDFDGTLADSADWFFGALNAAADRFGFRRTTPSEQAALRRMDNRAMLRALRVPMWKLPAIARHMRREAGRSLGSIHLFDGVGAELEALNARGVRLAIVSSNAEENVKALLGPALAGLIDFYGCGSSLFGKPAKLRQAMRHLAFAPAKTVCVGDETRDIEAARSVRASAAAVSWGYAAPEALIALNPTHLIRRIDELRHLAG